jgi:hypothetical protein
MKFRASETQIQLGPDRSVRICPIRSDNHQVEGRERWTDTLINVRAGDTLVFDADGTVRLSDNSNDVALSKEAKWCV